MCTAGSKLKHLVEMRSSGRRKANSARNEPTKAGMEGTAAEPLDEVYAIASRDLEAGEDRADAGLDRERIRIPS